MADSERDGLDQLYFFTIGLLIGQDRLQETLREEFRAIRAAQPSAEPLGLDVREALAAANRIITMMRNHLAKDHPDCAYTVLDILNDSQRAALASEPDRPGVGEAPWDEADGMCPNCITPWKCNGPHLSEQTVAARRVVEGSARDGG